MKKAISIILSVIMLLGIMSTMAFAQEYDAGIPAVEAPYLDGIIEEGEYSWTSGKLDPTQTEEGVIYRAHDENCNPTEVEYFLAHDEEFIYLAIREKNESTSTKVYFELNPRVGTDGSQGQILISAQLVDGVASVGSAYEYYSSASGDRLENKGLYIYDVNGLSSDGYNVIEVQVDRLALEDYADGEFDAIGFRAPYQNYGESRKEAFCYGDKNTSSYPFSFLASIGHHILTFQPAPETEAPATEAPETEAPETEAPATEAPETEAPETEAPATDAPETEAPAGGCGSSVAAIGVAFVATLGTCTVFFNKKR